LVPRLCRSICTQTRRRTGPSRTYQTIASHFFLMEHRQIILHTIPCTETCCWSLHQTDRRKTKRFDRQPILCISWRSLNGDNVGSPDCVGAEPRCIPGRAYPSLNRQRANEVVNLTSQTRQYSLPAHSEAMLINNHRPPEPDLEAELAMDKMQCAQDSGVKVSSNEFETSRRSNDLTPASAFESAHGIESQ
jgi:hypothetical protein